MMELAALELDPIVRSLFGRRRRTAAVRARLLHRCAPEIVEAARRADEERRDGDDEREGPGGQPPRLREPFSRTRHETIV